MTAVKIGLYTEATNMVQQLFTRRLQTHISTDRCEHISRQAIVTTQVTVYVQLKWYRVSVAYACPCTYT